MAELSVRAIKELTLEFERCHKIYILSEKKNEKESFKDRANSLAVKNVGVRIKWYLDELQIIAKGVGIGQLNEYEAAKRLGIGTITGKYHQKALALKGITLKDF